MLTKHSFLHCLKALAFVIVIAVVMFTQVSISVAFKGNTHIWVGNEVLNDLKLNDCKVSIEPFGLFRVNDDICNSLIKYPQSYLLGNIGPDGFPDVVGGQMTVHPGLKNGWRTDDWLMKLVGALPKDGPLNDGVTGEKAFVYGYLAHAAADAFSHTYVNTYAGGFFLLTDAKEAHIPFEQEVETRHNYVEYLIMHHQPDNNRFTGGTTWLPDPKRAVPASFLRNNIILNLGAKIQYNDPDAGPVTKHLVFMYEYWDTLNHMMSKFDEILLPVYDLIVSYNKIVSDTDALITAAKNAGFSIPWTDITITVGDLCSAENAATYSGWVPGYLETCTPYWTTIAGYEATKKAANDTVALLKKAADDSKKPIVTWRDKVEEAVDEYIRTSAEVANEIVKGKEPLPEGTPEGNPTAPLINWVCKYAPVFAGTTEPVTLAVQGQTCDTFTAISDAMAQLTAVREDIYDTLGPFDIFFDPLTVISVEMRDHMVPFAFDFADRLLGSSVNGYSASIDNFARTFIVKFEERDMANQFSSDQSGSNLLIIPDVVERIKADMHLDANDKFDPQQFAPAYNAVVLAKLALLDGDALNRLATRANVTRTVYTHGVFDEKVLIYEPTVSVNIGSHAVGIPNNILFGFVKSLDGNHQWQEFAPPYPRIGTSGDQPKEFRSFGYSFESELKGFRFWQDCIAHKNIFNEIFIGPLVPAIETPGLLVPPLLAVDGIEYSYQPSSDNGYYPYTEGGNCRSIRGDLNYDGLINNADLLVMQAALGTMEGNVKYNSNADLDGDKRITINDYRILRSLIAGTI